MIFFQYNFHIFKFCNHFLLFVVSGGEADVCGVEDANGLVAIVVVVDFVVDVVVLLLDDDVVFNVVTLVILGVVCVAVCRRKAKLTAKISLKHNFIIITNCDVMLSFADQCYLMSIYNFNFSLLNV